MEFKVITDTSKKSSGKNTCEFIIVHHTGGGTFESNIDYLTKNPVEASVHYIVGRNEGEIAKIGSDIDIFRHAGKSEWLSNGKLYGSISKGLSMNPYSIGIEIVGTEALGFTEYQKVAVKELLQELMKEYNIPPERVLRHADITSITAGSGILWDGKVSARKTDVANNFWNSEYQSWSDYQKGLVRSKYYKVFNDVMRETNLEPIFNCRAGKEKLTEQETKELIEIAIFRTKQRTNKYFELFISKKRMPTDREIVEALEKENPNLEEKEV